MSNQPDAAGSPEYSATLTRLKAALPRLATRLEAAERMRSKRVQLMIDGVRFLGLEELLSTLDRIAEVWSSDDELRGVAFLVSRAIADFETAVEAGLSGYPSVASDAMRDVMEIELLLLYFYIEPVHLDTWLTADRLTRLRAFAPRMVRRQLVDLGLHEIVGTEQVELDYRGHSEALHVSPRLLLPFLKKGHVPADDFVSLDSSFLEVFEHARRLGNALLLLAHRLSPDSAAERACQGPLPAFELAHERTQEYFRAFLDLLAAASRE